MNATATRTPFLISTFLVALGIRAEQSIARHERRYQLFALVVFALFAVYHALTVPLWFDELFTLFISRLSSIKEMLRAMPSDGQPPLQYLLTHLSLRLFGETAFALRLPELLAYMAAGLLTYRIVRRHGTAVQALFALGLVLGSSLCMEQAYQARPYGLLIAFTALTFDRWQAAALKEHHRLWPLCGVAVGIAGANLSHYFGLVHTGLFLACGETARLIQRRRPDAWMAAAIAVGLISLVFSLPLAHMSRTVLGEAVLHSTNFWAKPMPIYLLWYRVMFSILLLCLVFSFTFLPWAKRRSDRQASSLPPVPIYDWTATCALCLLIPVLLLLTTFETGYILPKYVISTSLGLALLVAWGLPRLSRLRDIAQPLLALSTACYLLLIAMTLLLENMHQPIWNAQPGTEAVSPVLLNAPAGFPIVIANAHDYAPEWWYAPPSVQQRLIYLSDVAYAERQPDFLPELSLATSQDYIPLRVTAYAPFVSSHSTFLLFESGEPRLTWVVPRLANAGWRLTPIASSGAEVLYRVTRP